MGYWNVALVMMCGTIFFYFLGDVFKTISAAQSKEFFLMGKIGLVTTAIFLIGYPFWKLYSESKPSDEQEEEIKSKLSGGKNYMTKVFEDVKIIPQKNSDNETYYDLEFDGVIGGPVYSEPTKDILYCFKLGILSERERIWDKSIDKVNDKIMKELLNIK